MVGKERRSEERKKWKEWKVLRAIGSRKGKEVKCNRRRGKWSRKGKEVDKRERHEENKGKGRKLDNEKERT